MKPNPNPRASTNNFKIGTKTLTSPTASNSSKMKTPLLNNQIIGDEDYIPFELLKCTTDTVSPSKSYYLPKLQKSKEKKRTQKELSLAHPNSVTTADMLSEKRRFSGDLANPELLEK